MNILALLGCRVVSSSRHYLYLCIGIVIYGGLMEVAQSFTPNRMMSIYDLVANTVGVAFAMVIVRTLFDSKKLNQVESKNGH
ncbi:MAG: VanZ family protein [Halioglobus sp.]